MSTPPEPQPVLTPLTEAAIFLVVEVSPDGADATRSLLADLPALCRAVGFRIPDGGLRCVAGIGSDVWDRLFAGPRPAELHPFQPVVGEPHTAPATPGDLLFHIRAHSMDLCFELAGQVMDRLADSASVCDEVHGFAYFGQRDLLGFVDGTENPAGPGAQAAAIVAADTDPGFAGGSYVIVQKYLHNLTAWNALAIEEQERVIGRTKLSDIELDADVKPTNSHVALNTIIDDDGTEHEILRHNMAFGRVGAAEFGTYFIGYSATPSVTEQMLENMFLGSPPGNYDRILDFSTAVTGSLFFVPGAAFLDDLPAAPADEPLNTTPPAPSAAGDGSLRIGSLKRSPNRE